MDLELLVNEFVFRLRPLGFDDGWVEVVEPAFPALLGASMGNERSNVRPIAWAACGDEADNNAILFDGKWTFPEFGIQAFFPSGGDLGWSALCDVRGNQTPLLAVLRDKVARKQVFVLRPVSFRGRHHADFQQDRSNEFFFQSGTPMGEVWKYLAIPKEPGELKEMRDDDPCY